MGKNPTLYLSPISPTSKPIFQAYRLRAWPAVPAQPAFIYVVPVMMMLDQLSVGEACLWVRLFACLAHQIYDAKAAFSDVAFASKRSTPFVRWSHITFANSGGEAQAI